MNTGISHKDLDRTHKIGKIDRIDGISRTIIIRFASYAVRKGKNSRVKFFELRKFDNN